MASRTVAYAPSYDWVSDPDLRKQLRAIVGVPVVLAQVLHHLALAAAAASPSIAVSAQIRQHRASIARHRPMWGTTSRISGSIVYGRGNTVQLHGPGGYCRPVARHTPIWVLVVWALTAPLGPVPVV